MNDRSAPTSEVAQPPALRPYPSKLFVEVTTRCNLRCAMCVKEARGQRLAEGDLAEETFARLAPAFPHLEALLLNGIGEPLLHQRLEAFIAQARRAMPASGRIAFQTNGQLLGEARARSLADAGVDQICVSADAVTPELFSALRSGGRQEAIEEAAAALHEAGRARGRPISLGAEFVVMRDNLRQLPELVRWAARKRLGFVIVTHMIPYSPEAAGAAAFDVLSDASRDFHREWKRRTEEAGLDISTCYSAFIKLKYGKRSSEDQRLVEHMKQIIAHAAELDVWLNIERLMTWDEAPLRELEEAFAAAAEIARQEGVELRLPAAVPRRQRRCDFVEEGGAFVSWDGDLHPCHFLWHGYSCHIGGFEKQVKPLAFGNVTQEDVLALWNSEAARAFRQNVLQYDYPFCYDCNVALCNYVEGEEVEQDCHVRTVPCGACLWGTGVFQCLR